MLPSSCLIDGGKSPPESLGATFRLPLLQLLGASIPLGKQCEASSLQTGFSVRALMPPPAQSTLSPFQIEVEPNLQSFTLLVLETSPQTSWIRGSSWMRGAKQKCTAGCTSRIGQNQPQLGGALCIPEVHGKQVPGHD